MKGYTPDVSAESNGLERGPDDATMIIMTGLEGARVWDLKQRSTRFVLHHGAAALDAVANHRGTLIATASSDGTARLYSAKSGEELAVLRGSDEGVSRVAFTGDDKRLVTTGKDGLVRIWRISESEFGGLVANPIHPIDFRPAEDVRAIGWRLPEGFTSASAEGFEVLLWSPLTGHVHERLQLEEVPAHSIEQASESSGYWVAALMVAPTFGAMISGNGCP